MKLFSRNAKGFSLLELLLSIAIISLIILMATRYFSSVRVNQKASEVVSFIQGIRGGVSSLSATGNTITTANMCTYNQIPKNYCNTDGTLISPLGTVTFTAPTSVGGSYTVKLDGIPDIGTCNSICSAFAKDTNPNLDCTTICTTNSFNTVSFVFNS